MKFAMLSVSAVLLVAGCATSEPEVQVAAGKEEQTTQVRCRSDSPTGSNFRVTRCRTPEEIERDKAQAQSVDRVMERGAITRSSGVVK